MTLRRPTSDEVLFQATKAAMRGVEGYDSWLAIGQAQVAALMADPDLLVDLAIEAGGLLKAPDAVDPYKGGIARGDLYRRTPEADR